MASQVHSGIQCSCGARVGPDDTFCGSCGEDLSPAVAVGQEAGDPATLEATAKADGAEPVIAGTGPASANTQTGALEVATTAVRKRSPYALLLPPVIALAGILHRYWPPSKPPVPPAIVKGTISVRVPVVIDHSALVEWSLSDVDLNGVSDLGWIVRREHLDTGVTHPTRIPFRERSFVDREVAPKAEYRYSVVFEGTAPPDKLLDIPASSPVRVEIPAGNALRERIERVTRKLAHYIESELRPGRNERIAALTFFASEARWIRAAEKLETFDLDRDAAWVASRQAEIEAGLEYIQLNRSEAIGLWRQAMRNDRQNSSAQRLWKIVSNVKFRFPPGCEQEAPLALSEKRQIFGDSGRLTPTTAEVTPAQPDAPATGLR